MTPRIPPKSGSSFAPGQIIRIEFPAQGYVNPINTTLEFDVTLFGTGVAGETVRFQNNIQSIFSRVRLLYGATPLEDIINYNHIVRALTEWTATNQQGAIDQTSIAEGIGGYVIDKSGANDYFFGNCNTRQKYIHGVQTVQGTAASTPAHFSGGGSFGNVGNTDTPAGVTGNGTQGYTRRYQVNLALGLFTQDKLIPVKFMASQLAIEITLEQATGCIFAPSGNSDKGVPPNAAALTIPYIGSPQLTINPTYGVGNVNLIPEILQFDASYGIFILI